MPATDIRTKLNGLFPAWDAIPSQVDFAPNGGTYPHGTLYLVDGDVRNWNGEMSEVESPICVVRDGKVQRRALGRHAALTRDAALEALNAAVRAYDNGRGLWPTMKVAGRIEHVLAFTARMRAVREESVRLLMWEIGKTRADAEKEFDRTVQYVTDTVEALKEVDRAAGRSWTCLPTRSVA